MMASLEAIQSGSTVFSKKDKSGLSRKRVNNSFLIDDLFSSFLLTFMI